MPCQGVWRLCRTMYGCVGGVLAVLLLPAHNVEGPGGSLTQQQHLHNVQPAFPCDRAMLILGCTCFDECLFCMSTLVLVCIRAIAAVLQRNMFWRMMMPCCCVPFWV